MQRMLGRYVHVTDVDVEVRDRVGAGACIGPLGLERPCPSIR